LRGYDALSTDPAGNIINAYSGLISFDLLLRANRFYVGPGIARGAMSFTYDGQRDQEYQNFSLGGPSATVYSLTAGYDLTSRMFVETRWQNSSESLYNGISIVLGLRFQS
jgi:hypothetical protein